MVLEIHKVHRIPIWRGWSLVFNSCLHSQRHDRFEVLVGVSYEASETQAQELTTPKGPCACRMRFLVACLLKLSYHSWLIKSRSLESLQKMLNQRGQNICCSKKVSPRAHTTLKRHLQTLVSFVMARSWKINNASFSNRFAAGKAKHK